LRRNERWNTGKVKGFSALQKPEQHRVAQSTHGFAESTKGERASNLVRAEAMCREPVQSGQMTPTGFEHSHENTGKTAESAWSAAKSGAIDARLATILDAWPRLPADVQETILALVRRSLSSNPGLTHLDTPDAG
jgi:hypothetical protein